MLIDYILKNKEWIFSGIGVVVVSGVVWFCRSGIAVLCRNIRTAPPKHSKPLVITIGKGSSFEEDAFEPYLRSTRRVCIMNTSAQTIYDVQVHLEEFTPQGAPFLPIRLQEMHKTQQPFRLHPLQSVYVNVASYYAFVDENYPMGPETRSEKLILHYDDPSRPNVIPIAKCPYTLTIKVSGRNIDPVPLTVTLMIKDGKLELSSAGIDTTQAGAGTVK